MIPSLISIFVIRRCSSCMAPITLSRRSSIRVIPPLSATFPGVELQNSSSGFYVGYNYGYATMAAPSGAPVTFMFTDNHGPHDMMNLWEGNIGELFGSDGYFGGSSHGTAVRNYLTGYNPISGQQDDPVLVAVDRQLRWLTCPGGSATSCTSLRRARFSSAAAMSSRNDRGQPVQDDNVSTSIRATHG